MEEIIVPDISFTLVSTKRAAFAEIPAITLWSEASESGESMTQFCSCFGGQLNVFFFIIIQ